jgi:predicted  nucleic acid-binding Zn-ribbon protein
MEGYICQNCGENWAEADLQMIDDVQDRVMAGDTMPDGQCPECGGVCFAAETPEEQAAERVRRAGPELLRMLAMYHDYFAGYDLDGEFPDFNALKDEALTLIEKVKGIR